MQSHFEVSHSIGSPTYVRTSVPAGKVLDKSKDVSVHFTIPTSSRTFKMVIHCGKHTGSASTKVFQSIHVIK